LAGEKIKVLLVDDSALARKVIIEALSSASEIVIVGTASNGKEAFELIPDLRPNIIITDINMPIMDGMELTKNVMAYYPTPILIVSVSVFKEGMEKLFEAISYGALDAVDKGVFELENKEGEINKFVEKVKFLSKIKVITHPLARILKQKKESSSLTVASKDSDKIIAIASSTGGPQALLEIFKNLPKNFPAPIVVVQHISLGFTEGLVDWLSKNCSLNIRLGKEGLKIEKGNVYIAPSNFQMLIQNNGEIKLIDEPFHNGFKPSADILLESVAIEYKNRAIGVILTGMGRDGVLGIKAIKDNLGHTIAQDEKTSIVFGMPKAAIEMGVIDQVLSISDVAKGIMAALA